MSSPHPLTYSTIPDLEELQRAFPSVSTLLFDMDGTLFDTEKYHAQALLEIGHDLQIIPPVGPREVYELMVGKADHLLYDLVKDWPNFPGHWSAQDFVREKNLRLLRILAGCGDRFFPERLRALLHAARAQGLSLGLVTSSEKIITTELLKIAGLSGFFAHVLTRDDSLRVKPDPWPYLEAMRVLKADPTFTLVFEDSAVGIDAARASGAHVIKVEWHQ